MVDRCSVGGLISSLSGVEATSVIVDPILWIYLQKIVYIPSDSWYYLDELVERSCSAMKKLRQIALIVLLTLTINVGSAFAWPGDACACEGQELVGPRMARRASSGGGGFASDLGKSFAKGAAGTAGGLVVKWIWDRVFGDD